MRTVIVWISFILLFATPLSSQNMHGSSLNIATFNIRMDTSKDGLDAWSHRKEMVNGLIRFHDFDIFGIQEGFHHQIMDILEPGDYDYVGVGRDDGKEAGEHSAILYKRERFLVLDKGDFWFSETPDIPSKGWDATCCNRICSWVKFKDSASGKVFYFFNVHYDHQGKEARRQSSILLMKKIRQIAGGYPVICTGDFNATPDSEPIQIILEDGLLNDSYRVTLLPPYGTTGTFNSFNIQAEMTGRIDYIWTTKDIMVQKYGVLNDIQYGHFPSDHFPVMVNVIF
jgi:endonuclease/exonuclease/phosphatase family metal-dependent hydrolase